MKTMLIVLLLGTSAMACDKGCSEYEGVCACDIAPAETAVSVKPSDEKPPRSGMPAWQDPSIHAMTPPSLVSDDEKQDLERMNAMAAGKKAAGIAD